MSPKQLDELGAKFATNPVCVGPFMFKDRVAGRPHHARQVAVLLRQEEGPPRQDRVQDHHRPARRGRRTCGPATSMSRHSTHPRRPSCRRSSSDTSLRVDQATRSATRASRSTSGTRTASTRRTRTSARRLARVAVPAQGVRARARPQADQQGRVRRHAEQPGCYPISPSSPWYAARRAHVHLPTTRRGEEARQGVGRLEPDRRASDDRHRPGRARASAQFIQAEEKAVGINVDPRADRVHDVAQRGRRRQLTTRSRSAGRAASTRTATSTSSSPRRARRTTAATRTRSSTRSSNQRAQV